MFDPRSFSYALFVPAVSAGLLGYTAQYGYSLAGYQRPDLLAVGAGITWFILERAAWLVWTYSIERENRLGLEPTRREMQAALQKGREQERLYAQYVQSELINPQSAIEKARHKYAFGREWVSKHQDGGIPWLGLPFGIGQPQVSYFYERVITEGQKPTEGNLVSRVKPFTQKTLKDWREWCLRNRLGIYERAGNKAGWQLTPIGTRAITFIYHQLTDTPPPYRFPPLKLAYTSK